MGDLNDFLHKIERALLWGVVIETSFAAGAWVALQVMRGAF